MNKHRARTPKKLIAPKGKRLGDFDTLTFEQIVTLWRIRRGGITDIAANKQIVGVEVNGIVCKAAMDVLERALSEPLPLAENVRCCGCGSLITAVPCILCGRDYYRVPDKR